MNVPRTLIEVDDGRFRSHKAFAKHHGLTQIQLAEYLGVTTRTLQQWGRCNQLSVLHYLALRGLDIELKESKNGQQECDHQNDASSVRSCCDA